MDFLFDIGRVIVHFDFISALQSLIPKGTENPDERIQTLLERKDELEAGRLDASEYFPWAADTLGFTGSQETFIKTWRDIFTPNDAMWKNITTLHEAGHRLILFSNIQAEHLNHLKENYSIFQKFNGGIFSYETGHVKPEPEIYQLAIDQYGLTPEKTAYIDDLPANITAGKKAGLLTHLYDINNHTAFTKWLEKVVGDDPITAPIK